jgi:hypothetical protein
MCYLFMDSHFSVRKMVQDEQFLSSLESGLRFKTNNLFPVWKMVQDEQFISSLKSGLRFLMDKIFPVLKNCLD